MGDDFSARTAAFLSWFQSLPGSTFHPDIEIQDLRGRGAGRGIVAKADIGPDTVLFTVPRRSVLCSATSDLPRLIPDVFDADDLATGPEGDEEPDSRQQDSWSSLILMMVREHLRGAASPWRPYLDVLPTRFDTPMFWADADVAELQASPVVGQIGREQADSMIRSKILPVIREHPAAFYPDGGAAPLSDDELVALANQMGSTIMAYAFDLERDDDDDEEEGDEGWVEDREGKTLMGMVPMADILNADAEFNAHVNHGEDALTVTSLRRIAAGEEVLNYYGPLSSGELLRRYGYVTPKHRRYDLVDLPWDLVVAALRRALPLGGDAWARALQQLDPDELEDGFALERDAGDPDAEGRFPAPPGPADVPEDLAEQTKGLLRAVKRVAPAAVPDRAARDRLMCAAFLAAIDARAAQYPTTLEHDEALRRERAAWAGANPRLGMALEVRIGEKALLREARFVVEARLGQIAPGQHGDGAGGGEPSAKRQKTRS